MCELTVSFLNLDTFDRSFWKNPFVLKEVCHPLFKHKMTSAYHQQSNGLDERLNQTLKSKLQQLINEHMDHWDELINIHFCLPTDLADKTPPSVLLSSPCMVGRLVYQFS